jgi:hypothetical protein
MNFIRLFQFALLALVFAASSCNAENCEAETCANPDASDSEESVAKEPEDPNCPSRPYIIRCAGEYLDTNKNGKLDRGELQSAIDSLPWYSRSILSILGSVDKMMQKCDMDGDDAISMDYDMEKNKEQCLATCFKRRAFKASFFPDCE